MGPISCFAWNFGREIFGVPVGIDEGIGATPPLSSRSARSMGIGQENWMDLFFSIKTWRNKLWFPLIRPY